MLLFGILAIIIHSVFLYSVFDIYFKSPIIHGMTPYSVPLEAPAKRLVLIVADGFRADKFYELSESGASHSPFLRDIVTNVGAWGVSHTRVPTESRPGHVALIAGIYEDVSAVAKGWKENPVEFDSVFNESRYTWAWGSPDILPMFTKGAKNNVYIDMYTAAEEDFAGAKPYQLDQWVFKKVQNFFEEAKTNSSLRDMLAQDKLIFFLHLLGLDISGHSYKPDSEEYIKNIRVVDAGVEACVNLIDSYYLFDQKTAYIFTSDHGMTDWGSHGSGDIQETYTPIVAWGAGIRGPLGEGKDLYHDGLSAKWNLAQIKRVDMNQVDIAPLMSTLIGAPLPVNSMGILPVEYLGTDWPHRALALLTNARQVLAHYQHQMLKKKENTLPFFFWNFKELSPSRQAELMFMIDTLLKQNRYKDAIQVGMKIIEIALKGLEYYQKHDRIALSLSIFLGFLGWISYVIVLLLKDYTSLNYTSLESSVKFKEDNFSKIRCVAAYGFLGFLITFLLNIQNSPSMYYAYFLLPVFLWMLVSLQSDLLLSVKMHVERRHYLYKLIGFMVLCFIALELLVLSFFKREVMSFILWSIAVWPFFSPLTSPHKRLCIAWLAVSLILSIFPFMSVVGRDSNYNLVILAGWLFVFSIGFCAKRPETGLVLNNRQFKREPFQIVFLTASQVILLCIATYNVQSTTYSIGIKEGLPLLNQIVSWLILSMSLVLPLFGSQSVLTRLLNVVTSLFAPYLLLCVSHEGMFCFVLCIEMFLWLSLEHHLSYNYVKLQDLNFVTSPSHSGRKASPQQLSLGDIRRAYFFVFFILLAFYGTGNIASINSFDPTSVYCFLTVFNPFVMGFLILLKILIPFLIVSCAFRAIMVTLKVSPRALFLLVLLITDFLALHFFFLVKDSGSWLDIGTSLSHYIISMTTTIFIMLLYALAWLLTSCSLTCPSFKMKRHLL